MGGEEVFLENYLAEKGGEVVEGQRRPGAPPGNRNSVKHNRYGRELRQIEQMVGRMVRAHREFLGKFTQQQEAE